MPDDLVIEQLTSQARYHRERYDLYRAKMYGPRPTTHGRLEELRRACDAAEERLATVRATRARQAQASGEQP